ncbi:MAG TPA: ATP-binding protein [Anaeromyxobacter sp.]|nr:ATP-binding protein [Anaeromyxobacter sp.]
MSDPSSGSDLRVLVLAPFGRDAEVTCDLLRGAGIATRSCADLDELGREVRAGAGAIIVTAEALGQDGASVLARILESQEPWSRIPVVFAGSGHGPDEVLGGVIDALEHANLVTVLERPFRFVTLRTVVRSALRSRQRQYELRDLLEQLHDNVERLDAERVVRERFVSLLAHDLRGPLSAASMAAKMLVAHPERLQERRDLAIRIERNMLRVDRMIQDLLDANRVRAGHRLALDLKRCDLVEIASDVITDLQDADRERVRLSAPDRLEGVWAPDQLTRALWNLITNALKHGAPGGQVDVGVGRAPDGVVLSVHNAGPEIPLDEQARLFEPFSRSRGAEARARGWGLGLTLVRGCAEAHGGAIELSSSAAEGTTFTLRLPLDARPFQAAVAPGTSPVDT